MGRLLKKKALSKKKKQSSDALVSSQAKDVVAKKTSFFSGSVGDTKKRQLTFKKVSNISRTVTGKQKKNYLDKGLQFLREVKVELKKVTWPTRKQTIGSTIVVIILVMIIALFLGVVDLGLSSLVRIVLQ